MDSGVRPIPGCLHLDICRVWDSVDLSSFLSGLVSSVAWTSSEVGLSQAQFWWKLYQWPWFSRFWGCDSRCCAPLISFAGPFPNGSVFYVELHALWRCVLLLDELGVVGSILEGDSKIVVGWALASMCPWIFLDKIKRIVIPLRLLVILFIGLLVLLIRRLMNCLLGCVFVIRNCESFYVIGGWGLVFLLWWQVSLACVVL